MISLEVMRSFGSIVKHYERMLIKFSEAFSWYSISLSLHSAARIFSQTSDFQDFQAMKNGGTPATMLKMMQPMIHMSTCWPQQRLGSFNGLIAGKSSGADMKWSNSGINFRSPWKELLGGTNASSRKNGDSSSIYSMVLAKSRSVKRISLELDLYTSSIVSASAKQIVSSLIRLITISCLCKYLIQEVSWAAIVAASVSFTV